MALRSQLITKEFPELDRVERLNNEAFPEEERIPLSEFLQLDGRDDYHFFAFYDEDDFVGFASVLYNAKVFEPNDNPEQRAARWDFYKRNGFKTSNAFLEYEGLSFEILYRGDHFDEEAYREIFHKLQENAYFDFSIKHRCLSDL